MKVNTMINAKRAVQNTTMETAGDMMLTLLYKQLTKQINKIMDR